MTLYVYDTQAESERELVATIEGSTNAECEAAAMDRYPDTERYGYTYSPAFGTVDGLN